MVEEQDVWKLLEQVFDPEVPVLTVVDLGVIRRVSVINDSVEIDLTPTYSGCPAMQRMESDIKEVLGRNGIGNTTVNMVLSPAWTTDWITEKGRVQLKEYGIAPPVDEVDKSVLFADKTIVPCPKCDSQDTKMISQFGSTSCKAHYQCNTCLEPFDYFKCLK